MAVAVMEATPEQQWRCCHTVAAPSGLEASTAGGGSKAGCGESKASAFLHRP